MVRDTGAIPGLYAPAFTSTDDREAALKTTEQYRGQEALIGAMRAVSSLTHRAGPFHSDHFGNVIAMFISGVWNEKTASWYQTRSRPYPNVSQFWTFDEKWFSGHRLLHAMSPLKS